MDTREGGCLGLPRVKAFLAEVARGGADQNTQDTMDVWQLNGVGHESAEVIVTGQITSGVEDVIVRAEHGGQSSGIGA